MPYHAKRVCQHPGCSKTYAGKGSYCENHAKEHNKDIQYNKVSRDMVKHKFYTSSRWLKIRALKLKKNPLCERCEKNNVITNATFVHHRDGNYKNNNADNLESQCSSCHSKEHHGHKS